MSYRKYDIHKNSVDVNHAQAMILLIISLTTMFKNVTQNLWFVTDTTLVTPTPLKSTPVRAWTAGGSWLTSLDTSLVTPEEESPTMTIWSVLASGAATSAATYATKSKKFWVVMVPTKMLLNSHNNCSIIE